MDIIGLHIGHNSTVSLMRGGAFLEVISEERFAYEKNIAGFPGMALAYLMKKYDVDAKDAIVALAGESPGSLKDTYTKNKDKKNYVNNRWFELTYENPWVYGLARPYIGLNRSKGSKGATEEFEAHLKGLGFSTNNLVYVPHHTAHAYSPLALGQYEDATVLTLDGGGDGLRSTVWEKKGEMRKLAETSTVHSPGVLYSCVTEHLGMRNLEHEYKVMGLAAYVREEYAQPLLDDFSKVLKVREDGLGFEAAFPTSRFAVYLEREHRGSRFDNVACASQKLTENLMLKWARNCIEKTGISTVAASGGVFMNVKANMVLASQEEFEDIFFTPSGGDESNAIGAAYYAYIHKAQKKHGTSTRVREIYLGAEFTNAQVEDYLKEGKAKEKYKVEFHSDIEGTIAELLAKGEIVARFAGRCEFGARALGNRSILGDPSKMDTFYTVNDQIKKRDFWMPFAPSMLDSRADEYIENPLSRDAPYMVLGFESTPLGRKNFTAALHHGDWTLRPQIVKKDWNPGYYKLLSEFESLTGIGGTMNTSFNLHGKPIATTPEQAMHVFENSGLEFLALENWMISKK
jgi:carbamoyltransferase